MSYRDIEKQVLKKIIPDKRYKKKLDQIIVDLQNQIEKEIQKRKLPVNVELVGSMAKDTFLKDNLDIDFFLCYPTSYSKEKIAKNTLDIGRKILTDTEESYAEHPYLRGIYKGFKAEIVPCYKIEKASQKLSAVDRTPLHTKYVKENLDDAQKPEVRLFKQFLRGINCYGAEAEIEGFSGYLCEILVIKYGSFKKLLKNAQNWKYKEKLALKKGNYPDFDTPLIFIDPVDPERNVASALSDNKFNLFIKACEEYLKNPSIKFFFPNPIKPWSLDKIKKELKNRYFVGIKFKKPDIIDENLYPQIRKTVKSIWDSSIRYNFKIYDADFEIVDDLIYIIIKTDSKPLSKTMIHMGPPTKLKDNSKEFINKWKSDKQVVKAPYKKDNRYYVEIKRKYTDIKDFLSSEFEDFSLGKDLEKNIKSNYEVLDLDELLIDELRVFWTSYLDNKTSWER
jgi:tRNA nucleotidyltransferase (CCA-adding enzyme)